MTFTDDDLKLLKIQIEEDKRDEDQVHLFYIGNLEALLARLEAAETFCNSITNGVYARYTRMVEAHEAWRKAKGDLK